MRSKVDAINNAEYLHDEIDAFVVDNFGITDDDIQIKTKYSYGDLNTEDKVQNRIIVLEHAKNRIEMWSGNAVGGLRAANAIFPKTPKDLEQRRYYQNQAVAEYTRILGELKHVMETFSDINVSRLSDLHTKIRDEISLIKKWRRSDEKR